VDGVAVIRALLAADGALVALVPAGRIVAGVLPLDTPLDAIAVDDVSTVDRNIPAPGATRHAAERVQVTVMAASYPRLKAAMRAVRHAAADYAGDIAGLEQVTVQTAGTGPYFLDSQSSIHMKTQDFLVEYTEAR
jgi:hypothetical protein